MQFILSLASVMAGIVAAWFSPPVEMPAAPPAPEVKAGGFANADEVLTALETADRGLTSLTSQVVYDRELALAGDRQQRVGNLYFVNRPGERPDAPERRFTIDFTELAVGDRRESERQTYIFDGQWLLEKHWREREYVRRQVVPPGERFDPLRIGEGPMPIPIGQRKADILARYDAQLLEPDAGLEDYPELAAFAVRCVQLQLTPRAESDEFREVRLWYRPESDGRLLPRMARTLNRNGDESTVRLVGPRLNEDVPEALLDTRPPADWNGTIQPYRGVAPASGR